MPQTRTLQESEPPRVLQRVDYLSLATESPAESSRVVPQRVGGVRRKRVRAIDLGPNPSFFVVTALDVVVSSCANLLEPTVRSLHCYAVRLSGEISWATAALGVPEADLVVSMCQRRFRLDPPRGHFYAGVDRWPQRDGRRREHSPPREKSRGHALASRARSGQPES
jgi:hypothetical protein